MTLDFGATNDANMDVDVDNDDEVDLDEIEMQGDGHGGVPVGLGATPPSPRQSVASFTFGAAQVEMHHKPTRFALKNSPVPEHSETTGGGTQPGLGTSSKTPKRGKQQSVYLGFDSGESGTTTEDTTQDGEHVEDQEQDQAQDHGQAQDAPRSMDGYARPVNHIPVSSSNEAHREGKAALTDLDATQHSRKDSSYSANDEIDLDGVIGESSRTPSDDFVENDYHIASATHVQRSDSALPLPPVLSDQVVADTASAITNYNIAPPFFQNGLQAKSGFAMCFDIGPQHFRCWGQKHVSNPEQDV